MNRTITDIRENLDYVGCDNETAREMCDKIERLTEDNRRLGAVVCQTDAAELTTFRQAVEIVTDPEHPTRSFSASEGWTMIANSRYTDLLVAEAQLAERTEAARELHRDLLGEGLRPDVARWPWLEE